MSILNVGLPGQGTETIATPRTIFRGDPILLSGFWIIEGAKARDPGNTPVTALRAGMLMGEVTSGGMMAPSIIGVTTVALTAIATTLTIGVAESVELERRQGASGTFNLTGPPSAAGTVVTQVITYSAINTTTGVVTIIASGTAFIAGSFVQPTDGSQTIKTVLPGDYPIRVVDQDGTSMNVEFGRYPVGGKVFSSMIVNWPTDTSQRAWIVTALNAVGQYIFDHEHN